MAKRLRKACEDLNIGYTTALEFLKSQGFKIPYHPNYKLNDELCNILNNKFNNNFVEINQVNSKESDLIHNEVVNQNHAFEPYPKEDKSHLKKRTRSKSSNKNKLNSQLFLQEIWEKYIDVQEQMIRLRSVPINIIPDSVKIIGEKLFITVNEDDIVDTIINEIASTFNISSSEIDLKAGHFFADLTTAQNVSYEVKNQISLRAAANFINFQPFPVIDGFVFKKESPKKELSDFLKLSGSENSLDQISEEKIKMQIPKITRIILPISPNPVFFLSKEFPGTIFSHKTKGVRKKIDGESEEDHSLTWNRTIEILNGYFNNNISKRLNREIGLVLTSYDFVFFVNPNIVSKSHLETNLYGLPKININDHSFTFHTKLKKSALQNADNSTNSNDDENWDFDLKYTRLKRIFDFYFGRENVKFESKFIYDYDIIKFQSEYLPSQKYSKSDFWKDIKESFKDDHVIINESIECIQFDFNWENENIENTISNHVNKSDFINYNFSDNNDLQIKDISLDEAENLLHEKFPSIKTRRNDKRGTLYFYQEYQNIEQRFRLGQIIESELHALSCDLFNYGLSNLPENKEKYILEIDNKSKRESQASALKELRGSDFCIGKNYFGKLIRVNFPVMNFDISGNEFENTKQLFESHLIKSIEPNLTGDLEKVYRLRNSLGNIVKGTNLQNPNLKDFIFDAQKAKKIIDINNYTDPQSEIYKDIEYHLLNKRVNEPQIHAIIKTMFAEDLALIQGPPGTGKSTAIAEIIWQHIRKNPNERILLTSETNLAVDNAIDRIVNNNHNLVKPIRFGGEEKLEMEGRQFSIDAMKRWVQKGTIELENEEKAEVEELTNQKLILLNWIENIKERAARLCELDGDSLNLWIEVLSEPSKEIRQIFYDNYIKNCNVIGATCSSIGEKNTKNNPTSFFKNFSEIFGNIQTKSYISSLQHKISSGKIVFTTVIQDESSKATPAELSLPLIYGKKNIIIGDHRQLPPMLDKEEFKLSLDFLLDRTENNDERRKIQKLKSFVLNHFNEMEISHFERLFDRIDDSLKGIFNLQYRMHPDINEVIKQFYVQDGGLGCGLITPVDLGVDDPNMYNSASRYHGIEIDGLVSKENHVIWVDTCSPELLDGTSRINYGEVDAIREILTKFRDSKSFKQFQSFWKKSEDQQLGIISFYNKQIKLLENLVNQFRDIPIRVSTVDRFQGMERNIIIVSMVRSNHIASDKTQKADYNLYGNLGFPEQKDLGFAQSPNRLNVALSRAKRLLIIVGNSELFRQKAIYNDVYHTIEKNQNGRIIKYVAK